MLSRGNHSSSEKRQRRCVTFGISSSKRAGTAFPLHFSAPADNGTPVTGILRALEEKASLVTLGYKAYRFGSHEPKPLKPH